MRIPTRRRTPAFALLLGAACTTATAVAFAHEPVAQPAAKRTAAVRIVNATPEQAEALARESAGTQGLRAYRDPETGEFREPTSADGVATTNRKAAVRRETIAPTVHASGRISAIVGERFMSNAVVHRDASGRLVQECVQGPAAAERAVNTTKGGQSNDR